ncbi:MAG: protein phosphatase 2C domain-containing protein, partial [Myxococcota bacterium]|nr:protein phosphatase 2C domain-containing protein [Myxococcota bacterium]
ELELSEDSGVLDAMRERLRVAVKLAGRRIFDKGQEDSEYRGMGTTCLAMWLGEGNAILAHVGDSRGYLVRSSRIEQLTEDHSLVNERIRAGLMSPDEARNHRLKNVITRSLGYMQEVEVDVQVREVEQGDHFVLCSDGLSNLVEAAEIAERVLELGPEDASRSLIALACERGGDDNITVVVARVDEVN